MLAIVEDKAPF